MNTGAVAIAEALKISLSELAGKPTHRVKLSGEWGASWQTYRAGIEKIATQRVEVSQEGDFLQVSTITHGLSDEEGRIPLERRTPSVGQRDLDGLVRIDRRFDPRQGHAVLRAPPTRPLHGRSLGSD
jgi:hypothetical protein